jgi:hypothetical protein
VAVAVEHPHLVLDEEYRIVEVGPPAEAGFGPLRGRRLWETFPGSKQLFEPYYEKARQSGETVEFLQFYDGQVGHVRAVPRGRHLHLYWEHVHRLNTLTMEGLRQSLAEMIAALEERQGAIDRRRARASLRLVHGGCPT